MVHVEQKSACQVTVLVMQREKDAWRIHVDDPSRSVLEFHSAVVTCM